ncbi:hypothetical protein GCM10010191_45000 [Actinomadura vinacea]|uniref:Uncharacterized protein n=1 Tax=Actinomadura vinacea TaxID=115336 RepID=A0ABN3JCQ9_9ACTN
MSFGRGRHAATVDKPQPHNDRREHLAKLWAGVNAHPGIGGRLVERRGVVRLYVVRDGSPHRKVDVGCDFRRGGWWFVWLTDGRMIAQVGDVTGTADVIAHELGEVSR